MGGKKGGIGLTCPLGPGSPDRPCKQRESSQDSAETPGQPLSTPPFCSGTLLTCSPFSPGSPGTPGSPCRKRTSYQAPGVVAMM